MRQIVFMLMGLCVSFQSQAFPCFLTLVKDSCWTNYNVSVVVLNATTGEPINTILVPQGKSWDRLQFDCQPGLQVSFSATFTPIFWANDAGKTYSSQRNWSFPASIAKGDTAWNVTLCYPSEFAGVPLPPDAGSHCSCNTDSIPPVKPQ